MVKHLVVSLSLYFQFDLGLVLSFKKTFKKGQFGTILSWLVKVWCLHPQSVRLGYVARSRAVFCSKHPLLLFGVGFCWFCVVLLFGFVRGINVCILWTLPWNHEIFLEIKVLFFCPSIFFRNAGLRKVMGIYYPATFSPNLDSRVLTVQRLLSSYVGIIASAVLQRPVSKFHSTSLHPTNHYLWC